MLEAPKEPEPEEQEVPMEQEMVHLRGGGLGWIGDLSEIYLKCCLLFVFF